MSEDAPSGPSAATSGSGFTDATSEKLERMRREIVGANATRHRNAPVDPYDLREAREEILRGRDRGHYEKWQRVMEYHRFTFLTPAMLDRHPLVGPRKAPAKVGSIRGASKLALHQDGTIYQEVPHEEAQWRRFGRFAESFCPSDLVTLFSDDPERFDRWIREHTTKRYMRQQGIVIPDLVVNPKRAAARRTKRGRLVLVGRK